MATAKLTSSKFYKTGFFINAEHLSINVDENRWEK